MRRRCLSCDSPWTQRASQRGAAGAGSKYVVIEKEVQDKRHEVECNKEMWYTVSITHGPGIDRASREDVCQRSLVG